MNTRDVITITAVMMPAFARVPDMPLQR